jgi:predicted nucleic acid-binding protein
VIYLDTSALLPYYREEPCSASVEKLLVSQEEPVLVSMLTEVEVASALGRWVRTKELSEAQANRIENAFREDVRAGRFARLELRPAHYERAFHWLLARKIALRVLDALHMACAEDRDAELVTADAAMLRAAKHFGLQARRIAG